MAKKWFLAAVVVINLLLVAANFPFMTTHADGAVLLTVTLTSASRSRIASVSCEAFFSEEHARQALEFLIPPERGRWSVVADPYTGRPLQVEVGTSERTRSSLLWSFSRYSQFRHLVVIVRYADGRREGRLCDIPHLRKSRSLWVEVP